MTPLEETIAWWRARGVGENVLARVARLNPPEPDPGKLLRGFRPPELKDRWHRKWGCNLLSYQEAVRQYGRTVVDSIPRGFVRREGKRRYYKHRTLVSAKRASEDQQQDPNSPNSPPHRTPRPTLQRRL